MQQPRTSPSSKGGPKATAMKSATKTAAKVVVEKSADKAVAVPVVAAPVAVEKPAAVDTDFKVGDKAVYPSRGVAEIVSIDEKDIGGKRQRFYVLRLLDTDDKIMVPVSNAQAGLRRPMGESQIREVFRVLKVRDVILDTQTWNRRYRALVEKMNTASIVEVAEVLRDLTLQRTVKDQLSFSERQMLERARLLLIKEISVARNVSEDKVRAQVDAVFDNEKN
jgi:CarD family transcriptional regulator